MQHFPSFIVARLACKLDCDTHGFGYSTIYLFAINFASSLNQPLNQLQNSGMSLNHCRRVKYSISENHFLFNFPAFLYGQIENVQKKPRDDERWRMFAVLRVSATISPSFLVIAQKCPKTLSLICHKLLLTAEFGVVLVTMTTLSFKPDQRTMGSASMATRTLAYSAISPITVQASYQAACTDRA